MIRRLKDPPGNIFSTVPVLLTALPATLLIDSDTINWQLPNASHQSRNYVCHDRDGVRETWGGLCSTVAFKTTPLRQCHWSGGRTQKLASVTLSPGRLTDKPHLICYGISPYNPPNLPLSSSAQHQDCSTVQTYLLKDHVDCTSNTETDCWDPLCSDVTQLLWCFMLISTHSEY